MNIIVNGKKIEFTMTTINDLFHELNINPKFIAVELNGEIINRHKYSQISLKEKDSIEIIKFMGGG